MRLLFLTETIPFPPDSGGRIKTYNTLRILSQQHEVHCHAFVREPGQLHLARDLATVCSSVSLHLVPRRRVSEIGHALSSTVTGTPFVVARHFNGRAWRAADDASRACRFDAVYCDHCSMLEYGRRLRLPIVLDAHNVEFEIVRRHARTLSWSPTRLFAEMEWRRLEQYERRWYPRCRLIYAVSAVDAAVLRGFAGHGVPVAEVPISVDLTTVPEPAPLCHEPEILFVGGLQWPPNADAVEFFLRDVFPLVRQAIPAARFTVVGKGPDALASRFGNTPGVSFAGHVEDVERYFTRSRVVVAPIRAGSGMRVKILDALARRRPTVATTVGCEGIDVVSGTHLLVADTPADFARMVVRVVQDDDLASALARNGRDLIARKYDVPAVGHAVLASLQAAFPDLRPQ